MKCTKDTVAGANNGEDMEMCATTVYGDKLVKTVKDGLVPEGRIDEAALRIVLLAFEDAYTANYGEDVIGCDKHIALALKSAQEGITLLKNDDNFLPLGRNAAETIAVIGNLGQAPNIGDYGSSRVFPRYVVTPVEGITKAAPDSDVVFDDGSDVERAKKIAASADALEWYNPAKPGFELEHMAYAVYIGTSSADKDLLKGVVSL